MKSMVIKRIIAVLSAMMIAVTMMAVSVSAAYIRVTGDLSQDTDYRYAKSTAKNLTSITRRLVVETNLYHQKGSAPNPITDSLLNQSFGAGVVGHNGTVNSGEAKALRDSTDYAYASAVLYNGTVYQSGEYSNASMIIEFD